jgi:hypothetical protein
MPGGKPLHFQSTSRYTTHNGYATIRRIYECFDCAGCPLKSQCTKAQGNRKIRISFRLLKYRQQSRENLTVEEGERLRAARSKEVDTVFEHLEHTMSFPRFHLRVLDMVKTVWGM